jgi:hypothetical protein
VRNDVTIRLGNIGAIVNALGQQYSYAAGVPTISGGTSGGGFNEPSGYTTVINSGPFTVAPIQSVGPLWTNGLCTFGQAGSGGAPSGWSPTNLSLVPAGSTGYRIFYPATLATGGWSPVRFGTTGFSTNGTGKIYFRISIRLPAGYTTNGNVATKLGFLTSPAGTNHFSAGWDFGPPGNINTPTSWIWSSGLQTGSSGGTLNTATFNSVSASNCADGNWHVCELSWVNESVAGGTNGTATMWVDNVMTFSRTGVTFFGPGNTMGYNSIFFDPVYGGPGFAPPAGGVNVDFDKMYCSVQ